MMLSSLRLAERLTIAYQQDWSAKVRLSARARTLRAFDCRGRVKLTLGTGAVVSARGRNSIGVPILGEATKPGDTTVIVAESGSRLELGGVAIGSGCTLRVHSGGWLRIGSRTFVNNGTNITVHRCIEIGEDCAISWGVTILDSDGHRHGSHPFQAPVSIEDRVWLGCNVTVLKGVTVGAGSIVGAGAVVTRSCPPRSLLVGSPARIVKSDVEWSR